VSHGCSQSGRQPGQPRRHRPPGSECRVSCAPRLHAECPCHGTRCWSPLLPVIPMTSGSTTLWWTPQTLEAMKRTWHRRFIGLPLRCQAPCRRPAPADVRVRRGNDILCRMRLPRSLNAGYAAVHVQSWVKPSFRAGRGLLVHRGRIFLPCGPPPACEFMRVASHSACSCGISRAWTSGLSVPRPVLGPGRLSFSFPYSRGQIPPAMIGCLL
jgi:hypothetical protein